MLRETASGGLLLGLDLPGRDLGQRLTGRDLDPARLHLFGNLALEIDGQQTVGEAGAPDFDVVGQLEAALEAYANPALSFQVFALALREAFGESR